MRPAVKAARSNRRQVIFNVRSTIGGYQLQEVDPAIVRIQHTKLVLVDCDSLITLR